MADIQLSDVTKRYGDGYEAVKHMSLEIADGEFMILVGPSGCGKSTALRMIAGLEDISEGELRIGGDVVNDRAPKDRDIAMVFQNYALYPHMTVRENMAFPLKLAGVPDTEIDKKVTDAARVLDLEQHLDRKPANLSGGQRQRVAMGRAIVRDPKAFLMDEPLSNLDAKLRVQMRAQVAELQDRLGTTTVYVTHDQTEAMTLGDRVAVMRAGALQQVDSPRNLYQHPVNLFVAGFVGSPSMNFLPATVEGDRVRTSLAEFQLPEHLRGVARGEVILGIRPEDFEDAGLVGDRQDGITFEAQIAIVEALGAENFLHFVHEGEGAQSQELAELAQDAGAGEEAVGANRLVARVGAASDIRTGAKAKLWMDTTHVHLFDPQDGRSLTVERARERASGAAAPGTPAAQSGGEPARGAAPA